MAQSIAKTMHKDGIYSAEEVVDKMISISKELTRQECFNIHFNIVQHAQAVTDVTPAAKPRPSGNKIPKEDVVDPLLDTSGLQSDGGNAKSGNQSSDDDSDEGLLDTVLNTADQFQNLAERGDGTPQIMTMDQYLNEFTAARTSEAADVGEVASVQPTRDKRTTSLPSKREACTSTPS